MIRLTVINLLILSLLGCSRHVVVDPEKVPSLKSTQWTIIHEPAPEELDYRGRGIE